MLTCNETARGSRKSRTSQRFVGLVPWLCTALPVLALALLVLVLPAHSGEQENFCTTTAQAALNACKNAARDDYWTAIGNCTNVSDAGARDSCLKDAEAALNEAVGLCDVRLPARIALCRDLGEARYDPDWDPADFVDPMDIGDGVTANPFFPLEQGRRWVYRSLDGRETITVTVTAATKQIGGVSCLVVNDLVVRDDEVVENTDNWYAQDRDGNVWYCGEIVFRFETFADGQPLLPELVGVDGSWKAFRDQAKPGVILFAAPRLGEVYRREFALGTAEAAAEVLSLEGSATVPAPGASCAGTCLVTRDFTPIEPDAVEHKFYAPGVGLILALDPATGERVELMSMIP